MSLKDKCKTLLEKIGRIMLKPQEKQLKALQKQLKQQQALLGKQQELLEAQQQTLNGLTRELTCLRSRVQALQPRCVVEGHPQIIVSVTSYPARINCVPDVIDNMLAQTLPPNRIILTLSEENFPNKEADLPIRLLRHRANGLEILWVKEDLRSYKKLLPVMQLYPNDIFITVDDDLIYPLTMIEQLCEAHRAFPHALCAMRTHKMEIDHDGKLRPYKTWEKHSGKHILEPRWDLFATTGAGTLFPPHVFGDEMFNREVFTALSPSADDVWVKIMCMKYDVPVVLSGTPQPLQYMPDTQTECLFKINKKANDMQLAALTEHYGKEIWAKLMPKAE